MKTDLLLAEMDGLTLAIPRDEVVNVGVAFDMTDPGLDSKQEDQDCLHIGSLEHELNHYLVYALQRDFSFKREKTAKDRFVICLRSTDQLHFYGLLSSQTEHYKLADDSVLQTLMPLMRIQNTPIKSVFEQGGKLAMLSDVRALSGYIQHQEGGCA